MLNIRESIFWVIKRFYPNGRAYRLPEPIVDGSIYVTEDETAYYGTEGDFDDTVYVASDYSNSGGFFYRLNRALSVSIAACYSAAIGVQDAMMPDNPNFTIDDAHDWYRRLGIYDSGLVSLSDMKLAIAQKQSFPVTPLNRQGRAFIEQQLQAAGFNVYVYENRFPDGMGGYITMTPDEILSTLPIGDEYGDSEYGDSEYGSDYSNKIVNYLEESKDALFVVGSNYRSTFFVGGNPIGTFADVPEARKIEFRQLLLTLKQAQLCGFLFINYV